MNKIIYIGDIKILTYRKSKVFLNHYVYSYENDTQNLVTFKLDNVLSKLESSDVLHAYDGDPIQIDHLGSTEDSVFLSSLVYNIPTSIPCGTAVNTRSHLSDILS